MRRTRGILWTWLWLVLAFAMSAFVFAATIPAAVFLLAFVVVFHRRTFRHLNGPRLLVARGLQTC
jgi:hypothetical protein